MKWLTRKAAPDYVMALKGNQGNLRQDVADYFVWAEEQGFRGIEYSSHEPLDKERGRIEVRKYSCKAGVEWLEQQADWKGLRSIGMVKAEQTLSDATMRVRHYYISSLPADALTPGIRSTQ